jgi:hypothetical protein
VLCDFLHGRELRPVIEKSLLHFGDYLLARDGCLILDARRLGEPVSIAHSAFMILALLHAPEPYRNGQIAALAEGIFRQQRPDGSYRVFFADIPDHGEELYAGEAMLALQEAYQLLPSHRYLESMESAFYYYDRQYFRRDRVAEHTLVFFANWQSQACRLHWKQLASAGSGKVSL